ncbi:hypothetical protein M0811_14259 [Anaeramoeba ignava]|uniref:Ubiquitin-like protease family profile domain-containing protein n=1 Tax=Anaeramoeba ignava TaxID=1746090 RepID=A0A9Q0LWK7_ANAIG|nr:hypothetical protein M0811_14259 [Anaeramoeba ignava]
MSNPSKSLSCLVSSPRRSFEPPKQKVDWCSLYKQIEEGPYGVISHLSKKLNIPYQTLYSRYQGYKIGNPMGSTSNEKRKIANQKRCCRLTFEQENQISKILNQKILDNFIVSPSSIRALANQMFIGKNQKPLSIHWPYRFMKRNNFVFRKNKLVNKWTSHISPKQTAQQFWQECKTKRIINHESSKFKIDHSFIFNVDETNVQFFTTSNSIGNKGKSGKSICVHNTKQTITMIAAIAADGTKMIPTFIIKAKSGIRLIPQLQKKFSKCYFLNSNSGWSNTFIMIKWLEEVLIPHIKDKMKQENNCDIPDSILVLDRFAAHRDKDFLKVCEKNKIRIIHVPSHMTGLLQPLDKSVFGPFKINYRSNILPKMNEMGILRREDVIENALKSWNNLNSAKIASSFRKTGVICDSIHAIDEKAVEEFEEMIGFFEKKTHQKRRSKRNINDEEEEEKKKEKKEKKENEKNNKKNSNKKLKTKSQEPKRRKTQKKKDSISKNNTQSPDLVKDKESKYQIKREDITQQLKQIKNEEKVTKSFANLHGWRQRILNPNSNENWLSEFDIDQFLILEKSNFKREDIIIVPSQQPKDVIDVLQKIQLYPTVQWIILPVITGLHWVIFVVNFEMKRIEYFNSFEGYFSMLKLGEKIAKLLIFSFVEVFEGQKSIQKNRDDCGSFICFFIRCRIFREWTLEKMRKKVIAKDGSEFRKEIYSIFHENEKSEQKQNFRNQRRTK